MNEGTNRPSRRRSRVDEGLARGAERRNGGGLLTTFEREALSLLSAEFGTTTGDLAQQMPSMKVWTTAPRAVSEHADGVAPPSGLWLGPADGRPETDRVDSGEA